MRELPEEIELYRDRKWRREESLKADTAADVEAMVNDLGFCLGLTDSRKNFPSVYIAVCGRRDAHMPRNVQKDYEASKAWVLKDEVVARGRVYYAKLIKGNSMFLSPAMVPIFNAIWRVPKRKEKDELSENARKVLKVLRKEWEMATADLRAETGIKEKKDLTAAIDELQRKMKVVPQEEWTMFSHLLIHHGRAICQARKPKCDECPLLPHCPAGQKFMKAKKKEH